ncbi:MAG: hypothetical protein VX944_08390 [Myxococcota bacterium]|jgi:hypothetical protein|nr:hypothetical protein [Myxococcota bacterium]MEC9390079.1 hypothetical protein [Myxococcota bacterium]
MHTNRLLEIEFATNSDQVEAANLAVGRLANHLELTEYRVEPLVRVDAALVSPWEHESKQPRAFAYRIHLGALSKNDWYELRADVLQPLAHQGVAVREVQFAA